MHANTIVLLSSLALAAPAQAELLRIGAAGAVSGGVTAAAPQAAARSLASGSQVFHKDAVTTDAQGRMQAMLLDETIFTVGPKSKVTLDEFVYDPFTDAGKVTAEVTKGIFRLVSGKSARRHPENLKIKLPVGTLGIRGTIVGGKVEDDGSSLIALLGPGADNNADERPGVVVVENAGESVTIDRPGYATRISEGQPPTPPFPLSPEAMAELDPTPPPPPPSQSNAAATTANNTTGSAPGTSGGGSENNTTGSAPGTSGGGSDEATASADSGQDTAAGQAGAGETIVLSEDQNQNTETSVFGSQSILAGGGAFSWEDLRATLQSGSGFYSGSGSYSCSGGACSTGGSGTFTLHFNVNWGTKELGGGGTSSHFAFTGGPLLISAETPGSNIPLTSFAALSGEAKMVQGTNYSGSDPNFNGSGFAFGSGGHSVTGNLQYTNGPATATGAVTSPCISGSCPP
ncbi:MAG: FecR domain-containing protein [Elusimicrobia bacterium]|nr:FecR domain-containing protein [Elusimicrobiota bacterium]